MMKTMRKMSLLLAALAGLVLLGAGCAAQDPGGAGREGPKLNSVHNPSSGLDRARLWYGDDSLGR